MILLCILHLMTHKQMLEYLTLFMSQGCWEVNMYKTERVEYCQQTEFFPSFGKSTALQHAMIQEYPPCLMNDFIYFEILIIIMTFVASSPLSCNYEGG